MFECCQCRGIESLFDEKGALKEQKQYLRHGPRKTTSELIRRITKFSLEGLSLLDIGGGVGSVQYELIKNGVTRVTSVDASSGYHKVATDTAARLNMAGKIAHIHGDFAHTDTLPAKEDIVTLDRVICCYPDMQTLVTKSLQSCRRIYGLVFPRETIWMKLGVPVLNLVMKIRRSPFRVFLHSTKQVHKIITDNGFRLKDQYDSLMWQVRIYDK